MGYAPSDSTDGSPFTAFKILIAGGFGAGKTTLVGAISEVRPLHTEEPLTRASIGFDDVRGVAGKTTTTVAMDFGRITMSSQLVLYLFGTPGQERFWFMWNDLVNGALGAVVLVDTRRLDVSFASVDFFEHRKLPFVVAVNEFAGAPRYPIAEVREALALQAHIPVISVDARDRRSARDALIAVSEYALESLAAS